MQKIQTLVFLLLVTFMANGQSAEEKEVAAMMEKLKKGLLDGDKAILEAVAAPELTYGHSSGAIEDKAAFVEALVSKKSDFLRIELSNQTIKIVGNTALVRHELHGENTAGPLNLGILLVWQKQNGDWKLIARQAYKL